MWKLDCEEVWALKNWCFWSVVLEKTLESPLDFREIRPVHPKGDQSWVFFGRTDAKAETPILWPPHEKSWLIGKDSDAGRDWGQEEKGMTEDEMAGRHHRFDGHGFGWLQELVMDSEACCAMVPGVAKSQTLSDWTAPNFFYFCGWLKTRRDFPNSSLVKNPPAVQEMQKTQVQSLDWEDTLEEEITNHSSILAWKIPWTEEPGRLQSVAKSQTQLLLLLLSRFCRVWLCATP